MSGYLCMCERGDFVGACQSAESDKEAQWEKILAVLSVCAETDHGGGAVPLASGHLQQHVWKSKNTLRAKRARFNHCDKN